MSSAPTQSQLCTNTPVSCLCPIFTFDFGHCLRESPDLLEAKSRIANHVTRGMNRYIWYSPLKDFWGSYRKLAWLGFEPTTTEIRSDGLADWALRPWFQLALRANFVQLLQYHLFVQCSHFISAIAFVSHRICFKRYLPKGITLEAEWIDISDIHHWNK